MSKNVAVFVDVANLYYSARGQDVDVDYVALLKAATKGRDLIRAYAYSGLDPENENQRKFIDFLSKNGYKVLTKDIRKFGDGRVKANLDIELVVDLFRLADRMDIAVIVSGDGDFAPAIKALQDKGVRCEVISFRPNTSSDLMAVTDEFIDVMKIAQIGRGSKEAKAQRGMAAPEMPAKEVVPEFGFREASPSVAKAALSAIRGGRDASGEGGGTGHRGRRPAAPAPAEEPAETATRAEADAAGDSAATEGEQRRRRRRRGGRGRGRGRGRAEQTSAEGEAAASPDDSEIGWTELDDVSQLAELEGLADIPAEREYSFEEADDATLAELGLTSAGGAQVDVPAEEPADEAGDEPAEEPVAKKPVAKKPVAKKAAAKKPARRSRSRTTKQETGSEDDTRAAGEGEGEGEEKKPARRRAAAGSKRAPKASGAASPAAEDEGVEAGAKPKPRTRTSTGSRSRSKAKGAADGDSKPPRSATRRSRAAKKADEAEAVKPATDGAADGDAEGIWQRFRSARETKRSS